MSSQYGSYLYFFVLIVLPLLIVYPFWVFYRYKKKMYPVWHIDGLHLFAPSGKIFVIATIIVNMLLILSIYGVKKGMDYLFTLDFLFIFLFYSICFIVIIVPFVLFPDRWRREIFMIILSIIFHDKFDKSILKKKTVINNLEKFMHDKKYS